MVVTAGAWVTHLVQDLITIAQIERLTLFMFELAPNSPSLTSKMCPNSSWGCVSEQDSFYTQPDFGNGFKLAFHRGQTGVDPDCLDRSVTEKEEDRIRPLVREHIPDTAGHILESMAYLYTNFPNSDWVIDRHPQEPRGVVGSPCSGHGFKFSSTIGAILADLAMDHPPRFDISPFALSRLLA